MCRWFLLSITTALLLVFLFPVCLHGKDMPGTPALSRTMPFELVSNFLIVVKGQVGEIGDLRFILDTGATYTLLDRKVADRLNLHRTPGKIMNFDRDMPLEWAEIPELRVGPIHAAGLRVMVAKLSDYSEFAENVDGILGLDLLSKSKKLFIDYQRQTIFLDWDETATNSAPGECFVLPVVVQGRPVRLILDTAFQGILLYRDRLHSSHSNLLTEGEATEVSLGRLQTTQVKLPGVRILDSENVATVLLMDGPDPTRLPGVDGYLGIASLHASRVEFDFVAKSLRWQ